MPSVYITKTAHFLPGKPIANDEIETYLGKIGERGSRAKNIVLRNNKITNRHYAMNEKGKLTHSNAEIAVASISKLFNENFNPKDLQMLAVGTSTPDVLIPSHGLQIHSLLKETPSIPVFSSAGVCCSSMHALEIAYLFLKNGMANNAIASGSELVSPLLKSDMFEIENEKLQELNKNGLIAFEKDFLRFMLSDGSGAFLLQNSPCSSGLNLEVEWMESISYANSLPACMYEGCVKDEEGHLISWKTMKTDEWAKNSVFSIKQDTRILENIIPKAVEFFKQSIEKHQLNGSEINYFLPHISSMYFYEKLQEGLRKSSIDLPEDIYYCCLPQIGNIGSASIYATLDRLTQEKELKSGEVIILGVPESAQFQYSIACLRVL
ncbi:MAG: StlD/DarB family beta-ketosynthase [Proteobacteria bacterium]|nr:StlD/DarB family beta-ketosynthase [Pseudomonadota bacterium]